MNKLIDLIKSDKISCSAGQGVERRYFSRKFDDYLTTFVATYKVVNEIETKGDYFTPPTYECGYEVTGIEDLEIFYRNKKIDLTEQKLADISKIIEQQIRIY